MGLNYFPYTIPRKFLLFQQFTHPLTLTEPLMGLKELYLKLIQNSKPENPRTILAKEFKLDL